MDAYAVNNEPDDIRNGQVWQPPRSSTGVVAFPPSLIKISGFFVSNSLSCPHFYFFLFCVAVPFSHLLSRLVVVWNSTYRVGYWKHSDFEA